ncbi:MAG TPA: hydrogenase maturation protease [Acidobacteriota bacterium]|nr:hydrogenase maturation protease [Acidobacteriota bacterium]
MIVGLGTTLGHDDAIGLVLVDSLAGEAAFGGCCVLLESADAATVASSLLEWRRPVVLVDAADMNLAPGEYRFFSDKDASVILKTSSVSTHGLGLAEGLELARALGFDQTACVFGVQPFDLSPGQGLTPEMSSRVPLLLAALREACC